MIRLGKLEIKNVGPFEEQEFDFHFDKEKDHPDIHIFTGANGTGKTTILHALANVLDPNRDRHFINNFYKRFQAQMNEVQVHINIKATNQFLEKIRNTYADLMVTYFDGFDDLKDDPMYIEIISHIRFDTRQKIITKQTFKFAALGYSGYRLIKSTNIKNGEESKDHPLHLALEFDKKIDENNNVSNWIISRYSKAAIEETHGNKALADKYRSALNCLMDSIEKLTDGEFTFAIKTNPWQVVTKYHGNEIEFDVLPDGLRSILSWMGDLLMRLDQIPWENNEIPVNEQDIILFLDEIEVHLHPKWQYRILPLTQTIFPNAQIFITTHSPFILNSIDNAKIYQLESEKGISKLKKVSLSNTGDSYQYIYEEILGVTKRFGVETENDLKRFNEIDSEIVQGNFEREAEFKEVIASLADEGKEVTSLISSKLFRLKRVVGKDYLPA